MGAFGVAQMSLEIIAAVPVDAANVPAPPDAPAPELLDGEEDYRSWAASQSVNIMSIVKGPKD